MNQYKKLTFNDEINKNRFFQAMTEVTAITFLSGYIEYFKEKGAEINKTEFNYISNWEDGNCVKSKIADAFIKAKKHNPIGNINVDSIEYIILEDKIHIVFLTETVLHVKVVAGDYTSELFEEIDNFRSNLNVKKCACGGGKCTCGCCG